MNGKKHLTIHLLLLLFLITVNPVCAQINDLERVSPESQGISSSDIEELFDEMVHSKDGEPHGIMILRNGKVIGELHPKPILAKESHTIYSASKTFVGIAVGLAVDEQKLKITDRVVSFFPDEIRTISISKELAKLTVRDLLVMSSGIKRDWQLRSKETEWTKAFLSKEIKNPGETFEYDSMVSYLLSAIVQRATGMKMLDYLKARIFTPMHITEVEWEESPEGINTGGWGLYMQVESMAKVGQLLLDKGKWNGKQLISEKWINEMMKVHKKTGMVSNFGYHIWYQEKTKTYRADGAFGQYIIISPKTKMVVAITQANRGKGLKEQLMVYDKLMSRVSDTPLKEGKAYKHLLKKNYTLPIVDGKGKSSNKEKFFGKEITLKKGNTLDWKSVQINKKGKQLQLTVTTTENEQYTIKAGYKKWVGTSTNVCPPYSIRANDRFKGIHRDFNVSGCYGWKANDELIIRYLFTNWISGGDLTFHLKEDGKIEVTVKENTNTKNESVKLTK